MTPIIYKREEAHLEKVSLCELASKFGTPLFVYSEAHLKQRCREFLQTFSNHPTQACYALKANSNLSLLRVIFGEGLGADVVSVGELKKAILANVSPQKIVFSGVGKRKEELLAGITAGIFSFQVESIEELKILGSFTRKSSINICLRVNPNINVQTNPYIATGLYKTKFGIPESQLSEALRVLQGSPVLKLIGLSCHLGSQIKSVTPYHKASARLVEIANALRLQGHSIEILDLGGGFGVSYRGEKVPSLKAYATAIQKPLKKTPYSLIVEPGRWIVAESGVLVSEVLFTKSNPHKNFLILDASMTELIRPALYEAFHLIQPCRKSKAREKTFDIVGPVCETSDFLGLSRKLPAIGSGDKVWISHAGAYGFSMSSHYNIRPNAAEILVSGKSATVIRKRESIEDLWKNET
ncbi:MAG: diaminopimelate decarboxylase [Proteobacteria bacterium]|nr:diaminopimelate decarboxylase [Pseudomonadota bacterium]NDC23670.1 diaminopimelate decarboxylase [Pseudomonadota bacterium]NDD04110.1 diaminopimelate decarboxylase [Pseudomonadota bacterium]NDG25741.1 diaminopimelate decarboxylase [Pseudomonadota bacterium]